MRAAALALCVLASAALWYWAASVRVELKPLPERLCGTFEVFRFEPPEGVPMANPLLAGQRRLYTFRPAGTYRLSIRVSGGYEMLRREGRAVLDDKQILALYRVSVNRREAPAEPEHYGTWWEEDQQGAYLLLRHVEKGYSLYLRRIEEGAAPAPGDARESR